MRNNAKQQNHFHIVLFSFSIISNLIHRILFMIVEYLQFFSRSLVVSVSQNTTYVSANGLNSNARLY